MKMGTIGTGMITEWLNTAFQDNGLECTAVYSRKEETGRRLADKYNMPKVYTDLDAMLHDEELDCIYIASPNSLHYPQAMRALEAGKNVILEKPFVSTIEECRTLIDTAKKHHRFLFEAITVPYNPNYQKIKERIGDLGSLKMVQCNFSQYSSKYDKFKNNENPNVFNPQFSGGALMDINIYNAHFIIGLFGRSESRCAMFRILRPTVLIPQAFSSLTMTASCWRHWLQGFCQPKISASCRATMDISSFTAPLPFAPKRKSG